MDIAAVATPVGVAPVGVGGTIIELPVRGECMLGRNTAQIETLGETVERLRTEMETARAEARQDNRRLRARMVAGPEQASGAIDALRVEIRQRSQMPAALVNHAHGADGRTVFTVPPAPDR